MVTGTAPSNAERKQQKQARIAAQLRALASLAAFVFVLGTFTWRSRTAQDIAEVPVDAAAAVRIAADVIAFGLVLLGLPMEGRRIREATRAKRLMGPAPLYAGYIMAGSLGVVTAVKPSLVTFRLFELTVMLAVAVALATWLTLDEVVRLMRRLLLFMSVLIFGSALAVPSVGLAPARGGVVPYRLEGVFPDFSANSVGAIGVLLVATSAGAKRFPRSGVLLGLTMVVLSQYRTGYVAVAAVAAVWLVASGGIGRRFGFLLSIPLAFVLYQSALFQTAWVRGEEASNSVQTLSGRIDWWESAVTAADRSPIIGLGLTSGTRYEILLGVFANGSASTIHGTWVEAYVGTGILGTAVLAVFAVVSFTATWRVRALSLAPALVITGVLVRSLTGTSIELASSFALFFLVAAVAASRTVHQTAPCSPDQRGGAVTASLLRRPPNLGVPAVGGRRP